MQRDKTLIPLSHDHLHGLILAQLLKKNSPPSKNLPATVAGKIKYAVGFYKSDLVVHFKTEEEILFPFVKGMNEKLDRMCEQASDEHKQIESYIDELKVSKAPEDLMDKLGRLLEAHIRKEERELFPRIELLLTEKKLSQLGGKITAVRKNEKPGK